MKTKNNLLIVCEGTTTEPEYFHQLRNDLISRGVDYTVVIKPKPPAEAKAERDAIAAANPVARAGAMRRQVKDVIVKVEEFMVEDAYLAQPTRYVREAQLGLIDRTYDEAWAVFDQDGHPEHPEAFALASADPAHLVHIGFSGIAFEHWLLLHFEYNDTAFLKSECRVQRVTFDCGQHVHADDCHGQRCVSGYMKEQGYITPKKNVKELGYDELAGLTNTALVNALNLRNSQFKAHPGVPVYQINPVTTVDRLVLKLILEPLDLVFAYRQPVVIGHHTFRVEVKGTQLRLAIDNADRAGFIFTAGHFILLDVLGNRIPIFERFIAGGKSTTNKRLSLEALGEFKPVYVGFKMEGERFMVLEIPNRVSTGSA